MSKYSKQFKLNAVNSYLSQSVSVKKVAVSLNVHPRQLSDWILIYQAQGAAALAPQTRNKSYSLAFKLSVLAYKRQHFLSLPELAIHFNIPSASTILTWERRYNQGGANALNDHRGCSRMKKPKNPKDPQIVSKPWSELTQAELLREIDYLQTENAYLKKLDALIREKNAAPKLKPKPSGD